MQDIIIFGAGGLGRLVHDIVQQSQQYRVRAFLDSDASRRGQHIDGVRVAGGLEMVGALRSRGVRGAIVAIGDNRVRVALAARLEHLGLSLVTAIHPLASVASSARIGRHVIIGPRAIVCVHAEIGPHSIILAGAIVEHDNRLGTGVFLHTAVRLAGGVRVEDLASLGIGASVIPGRRIGPAARVEPGAVVIRDVPPAATVGGAPASVAGGEFSRFVPDTSLTCCTNKV
jgi:sugar O-acyltransferase (sialic acid O-acetyltransferase NeuD family)